MWFFFIPKMNVSEVNILSEFYHHGIKGQKWGVRNGPPYPIDNKMLKKGTRLASMSTKYESGTDYKNNDKWMYTYNPDDEWDSAVYKGPFLKYKVLYQGAKFAVEHQYEVVKDLKMPTKQERIDEFISLYSKKKDIVVADLESVYNMMKQYGLSIETGNKDVDVRNLKTNADHEAAYEIFNHAMENVAAFQSTKAYAELMAQKYDAMVDDNNQGIYNKAHDPIIIFRANEALKLLNSRYISNDEFQKNYNKVADEMAKEGRRPKL